MKRTIIRALGTFLATFAALWSRVGMGETGMYEYAYYDRHTIANRGNCQYWKIPDSLSSGACYQQTGYEGTWPASGESTYFSDYLPSACDSFPGGATGKICTGADATSALCLWCNCLSKDNGQVDSASYEPCGPDSRCDCTGLRCTNGVTLAGGTDNGNGACWSIYEYEFSSCVVSGNINQNCQTGATGFAGIPDPGPGFLSGCCLAPTGSGTGVIPTGGSGYDSYNGTRYHYDYDGSSGFIYYFDGCTTGFYANCSTDCPTGRSYTTGVLPDNMTGLCTSLCSGLRDYIPGVVGSSSVITFGSSNNIWMATGGTGGGVVSGTYTWGIMTGLTVPDGNGGYRDATGIETCVGYLPYSTGFEDSKGTYSVDYCTYEQ